jgi:DNA-binding transcriptional regulator YiaG
MTKDYFEDPLEVVRRLVHAGVSLRAAKNVLADLDEGKTVFVHAPSVGDFDDLQKRLRKLNVATRRITRRQVDVKELRARLGMSQEAFAGRYGLDVATLRNWEQGRTTPEGPAATLLQLIDSDPDKVAELLAS